MKKLLMIAVAALSAAAWALSLADAKAQIPSCVADPAKMAEVMKQLSQGDQDDFLAAVNEAVAAMPASTDEKTSMFLKLNAAALKWHGPTNLTALLATTFATVPVEALTVINERFAQELFNRNADPSAAITDADFTALAKTAVDAIAGQAAKTDDGAARTAFAIMMFVRASDGAIPGLAETLAEAIADPAARQLALSEWIPAGLGMQTADGAAAGTQGTADGAAAGTQGAADGAAAGTQGAADGAAAGAQGADGAAGAGAQGAADGAAAGTQGADGAAAAGAQGAAGTAASGAQGADGAAGAGAQGADGAAGAGAQGAGDGAAAGTQGADGAAGAGAQGADGAAAAGAQGAAGTAAAGAQGADGAAGAGAQGADGAAAAGAQGADGAAGAGAQGTAGATGTSTPGQSSYESVLGATDAGDAPDADVVMTLAPAQGMTPLLADLGSSDPSFVDSTFSSSTTAGLPYTVGPSVDTVPRTTIPEAPWNSEAKRGDSVSDYEPYVEPRPYPFQSF